MKARHILFIFSTILILVIFILVQESIKHFPIPLRKSLKVIAEGDFLDFGLRRNQGQAPSLKNANYLGTCFICKCLCEVPPYQVSLIRDSRQPVCFICPKCLKKAIQRNRP